MQKIEAPVRDTIPDGSINVEERDTTPALKSKELNRDTEWFGTEIGFLDGESSQLKARTDFHFTSAQIHLHRANSTVLPFIHSSALPRYCQCLGSVLVHICKDAPCCIAWPVVWGAST